MPFYTDTNLKIGESKEYEYCIVNVRINNAISQFFYWLSEDRKILMRLKLNIAWDCTLSTLFWGGRKVYAHWEQ